MLGEAHLWQYHRMWTVQAALLLRKNILPHPSCIPRMLDKAFSKYNDLKGLIFHSDQGWQYQMYQYHKVLQDNGIIQSMRLPISAVY